MKHSLGVVGYYLGLTMPALVLHLYLNQRLSRSPYQRRSSYQRRSRSPFSGKSVLRTHSHIHLFY